MSGAIDDHVANIIIAQLLFLQSEDSKKDINLYINSPGGSVTATLAIVDTMNHIKNNVSTMCVGIAASGAALVLSAGTKGKRFALENKPTGFEELTVFDDWLDILQGGSYEIGIAALAVTSEEIGQLRGSAHINWSVDSGIRIKGATDGGDILTRVSFGGCGTPGQLIRHSTYLTFSGQTHDGWEATTDPMPRDGYRTHCNLPDVVWDLGTTGLTLGAIEPERHSESSES